LDTRVVGEPVPDDAVDDRPGSAAIRAAVETIAPAFDGRPGGVDVAADRHVVDLIDLALPGFVDMIGMLLDAYADDVRSGATMTSLSPEERGLVLRALAREEGQDARDVVDALFVFTLGAMYSEWSGYDRRTGALEPPETWRHVGYHGPVDGIVEYRVGI
jgi:hypothetical protein